MLELIGRARKQLGELALAERLGIGVEPPRIYPQLAVRVDLAEVGAFEHVAAAVLVTVARRAGVHVERAAARSRGGVDLVRARRRTKIAEPGGDPLDRSMVHRVRRHP